MIADRVRSISHIQKINRIFFLRLALEGGDARLQSVSRLLRSVLLFAGSFAIASNCGPKSADPRPAMDSPTRKKPKKKSKDFLPQAHLQSMARMGPMAIRTLSKSDSIAAFQMGLGSLGVPWVHPDHRDDLTKQLEDTWKEIQGIREDMLDPARIIELRSVRFALNRLRDAILREPPGRSDPQYPLNRIEALFDEIESTWLLRPCDNCGQTLTEVAASLPKYRSQRTAASLATARAAVERVSTIRERLSLIRKLLLIDAQDSALQEASDSLDNALELEYKTLLTESELLKKQPAVTSDKAIPVHRIGKSYIRIPDQIGANALRRRFQVEESVDAEVPELAKNLIDASKRLQRLYKEMPASKSRRGLGKVNEARCKKAWEKVQSWTRRRPEFVDASLDCSRLSHFLEGRRLSNTELKIEIVRRGVVEPLRHSYRRKQSPTIGLVSGTWLPAIHINMRSIMILSAMSDQDGLNQILDASQEQICLAYAALNVHAELESTDLNSTNQLSKSLRDHCPSKNPKTWIRNSLENPRLAMQGVAWAFLPNLPHEMVALDVFHWAPLGIAQILATPEGHHPDGPADQASSNSVEVKVEELHP